MTATTQARPKLWPLGVALAACLFFAMMFLLGGNSAHSATPVHANAPFALATDVTNTVIVTDHVTVTEVQTKTSFVPFTITQTANVTNTFNRTNTQNRTNVIHRTQTQVNHVNSTAVFNVNQTNQVNATVLATKNITKPVNVTNSVIVTNTEQGPQPAPSISTVEITATSKATKPLANRVRLAIGAGGVAVTSAAGFGFLMLRRRGRYTG